MGVNWWGNCEVNNQINHYAEVKHEQKQSEEVDNKLADNGEYGKYKENSWWHPPKNKNKREQRSVR